MPEPMNPAPTTPIRATSAMGGTLTAIVGRRPVAFAAACGGRRRSSTRSTRARSPTRSATASATSTGSARHLDHLAWLGVDAIWLSPFFRSPMADFGYDVGRLLRRRPALRRPRRPSTRLRRRGPRPRHPGAARLGAQPHLRPAPVVRREPRRRATRPKRDWYVWRDAAPDGGPPNNWPAAFGGGPAWTSTRPPASSTCTLFLPRAARPQLGQPRGRRGDARRAALLARPRRRRLPHRRRPPASARTRRCPTIPEPTSSAPPRRRRHSTTYPGTHALLRGIRAVLDGYPGDRMMVGEVVPARRPS